MNDKNEIESFLKTISRPSRYSGGELLSEYGASALNESEKKSADLKTFRFCFCFPDLYEIGTSNLGMKILYSLINSLSNWNCDRVFAVDTDFEEALRRKGISLYGLDSFETVKSADILGFSIGYELCYTNILQVLDLSGIEFKRTNRSENLNDDPIIIAGGCCAVNPEPLSEIIDLFVIGEGEEVTPEILNLYEECKLNNLSKREFLLKATEIEGVYAPEFRNKAERRIVENLDGAFFPKRFLLPYSETVHDRANAEVLRGCVRGCRFCQAGFVYRPYREKSAAAVIDDAITLCESGGFDEISLTSLSTGDHSEIEEMLIGLNDYGAPRGINLSLPSLRMDGFSKETAEKLRTVRKSGLTFAPEAGSERLRRVINKNLTESDILSAAEKAFDAGNSKIKLYFMVGLPTETLEDVLEIKLLCDKIKEVYRKIKRGSPLFVNVTLSTFVPKPFTPFQFEPLISREEAETRQKALLEAIKSDKKIRLHWNDYDETLLEAAFARGDKTLGDILISAYRNGARLDAWGEKFNFGAWTRAFESANLNFESFAERYALNRFDYEEPLPWDNIDCLVSKEFLVSEHKKALSETSTPNCKERCSNCGVTDCPVNLNRNKSRIARKSKSIDATYSAEPIIIYNECKPIRILFKKSGRAKFISQIDLMRTFQRAITRARIPAKRTEGFNPHIYVDFLAPTPLGTIGLRELAAIKTPIEKTSKESLSEISKRFNSAFEGSGIEIIELFEPIKPLAELKFGDYKVEFNRAEDFERLKALLDNPTVPVIKKTKTKEIPLDLKEYLSNVEYSELSVSFRLPVSTELTLSPSLLLNDFERFELYRIRLLDSSGNEFK